MSEQGDPKTVLKEVLGRAYSESVAGVPRGETIRWLSVAVNSERIRPIVADYLAQLGTVVTARSVGNRCACAISQLQLDLLRSAVAESSRS